MEKFRTLKKERAEKCYRHAIMVFENGRLSEEILERIHTLKDFVKFTDDLVKGLHKERCELIGDLK